MESTKGRNWGRFPISTFDPCSRSLYGQSSSRKSSMRDCPNKVSKESLSSFPWVAVKDKLVAFEFNQVLAIEARKVEDEAEKIEDEVCEENAPIGRGRRLRGRSLRSQQHLPGKGISESGENAGHSRSQQMPIEAIADVRQSQQMPSLGIAGVQQMPSQGISDVKQSQQIPTEGIADVRQSEVLLATDDEEDVEEEEITPLVVKKLHRDHRKSQIHDELQRMREENRPFTLLTMQRLVMELENEQIKLDAVSNAYLLQWCAEIGDLELGERLHAHMMKNGQSLDNQFKILLMEMYGKCGHFEYAKLFFSKLRDRNEYCYGIMVSAYARKGYPQEALNMLCEMDLELGLVPNVMTLVSGLKACTNLKALDRGRAISQVVDAFRLTNNALLGVGLVEMYIKCGSLDEAKLAFDRVRKKNVDCYNAMLAGYSTSSSKVLGMFRTMELEGVRPNEATYAIVLEACDSPTFLAYGKQLHQRVLAKKDERDLSLSVSKALVNMYGKCRDPKSAWKVFPVSPGIHL